MDDKFLVIESHGPLILSSNYWGSEADSAGTLYLSCNGGAFRLLLPKGWEQAVEEMKTGKHVIVSRGPWSKAGGSIGLDSLELLFDDDTQDPYTIHLGANQCDRLPLDTDEGQQWICTVWTAPRRGKPHKSLERPAFYRRVPNIPYLQPWKGMP